MTSSESPRGRAALIMAHVAGMVDLVSLPVWVNTLVHDYGFSPPQAGGLVTMFLGGVVAASLFWAPRFGKVKATRLVPLGYAVAACAFLALTQLHGFGEMAPFYLIGGVAVGTGLSLTHGTLGHSTNPHRLFAFAQIAFGVFGVLFLGGSPAIIAAYGGPALFYIFAGVMALAFIATAIAFPLPTVKDLPSDHVDVPAKFGLPIWCAILGVMLMTLNQAMLFSFVEHIGVERGFGADRVMMVLATIGFVNLLPGALAAVLEKKIAPTTVAICGAVLQAGFALAVTQAHEFAVYALPTVLMSFVMIFTHTFVFGLLARLEPSNRALASTPATIMGGSALGPFISGMVVQFSGYTALGFVICGVGALALALFVVLRIQVRGLKRRQELRATAWV